MLYPIRSEHVVGVCHDLDPIFLFPLAKSRLKKISQGRTRSEYDRICGGDLAGKTAFDLPGYAEELGGSLVMGNRRQRYSVSIGPDRSNGRAFYVSDSANDKNFVENVEVAIPVSAWELPARPTSPVRSSVKTLFYDHSGSNMRHIDAPFRRDAIRATSPLRRVKVTPTRNNPRKCPSEATG
jgi:hypothetical protein